MFKRTKVSAGVLLALGSIIAATSLPGFAQTTQSIEVTGSRIKRVDAETSQPIFVLDKADIQAQGLTTIGDIIQNITTNGSTLNSTFNNGGNGETRVSLRNLGSNRTLVLVNGKRWVGGLGGAVDLNTIPSAAVERIEVLKDGASVTYGSDAIAGVVNVILRNDFEGAEFNGYYGMFDEGDGKRQAFDIAVGSSGKRFRALLGMGYVKEEPVGAGDRYISAVPVYGTGAAFGSSTTPGGRFAVCNGTWNPSSGACSGTQSRPNGTPGQFTYTAGNSGTNWSNYTTPYNFAPDNYLITPQERTSVFARANFDITDNTSLEIQATFNNRRSEQLLAAMPIVLGTGPGAGSQARLISISENSIYNPFGVPVSRIQRRAVETGGRSFKQDVTTYALSAGLQGSMKLGGRSFNWDAGMMYARNAQSDNTVGLFNVAALKNALGPSMLDGGTPVCVSTAGNLGTRIPGCVPMNLLGAPGTITRAMLDYSSFVAHDTYGYKMSQAYANVSGDLFKLPGGMAKFAAGIESRSESGFDSPDALIASGNTTGNARTPTEGGYSLKEAYAELALPLLSNMPMVRALDLTLAARGSNYSNFGSSTNAKAGVLWKVNKQASIRANYSEGFRAPSISELFQGASDSFPNLADPCDNTVFGRYATLSPDAQARCTAQGVPVGGYDQGNTQIRISVGGNPNLKPETSKTTTVGFVLSPDAIPGFDVSVDWWKIKLSNGISPLSARSILDNCIIDNDASACALYTRAPGGQIVSLLESDLNFASIDVEGYDLTLNYRLPKTRFGTFSINWDSAILKNYSFDGGPSVVGQYADRNNFWKIRSNVVVRWEQGNFGVTWGSRFYSKQTEDCSDLNLFGFAGLCPPDGVGSIGGTTYTDVAVSWKTPWKGRLTAGVNNLFAKNPPFIYSTFANSFDPQYEIPGRFFWMRYSQTF